ncbi:TIGR02300 family protein [Roseibaca sp. Y0-43]|uniref:TIGR02300 family protein n=1 Tax=Roseibaca sp. Y0-43 TaxID=2816854 RepID=UPI001D0C4ACB|nr:TIGR02300 family protein [Roseibaca sp. Y0-43]MCC1480368.1 TIGR02300 family protein [Roseibaca sp. Y0-43]
MTNPDWGVKRICPETGNKFYDLNKDPIISPYTGKVVVIEALERRADEANAALKAKAKKAVAEDDDELLVDDDDAADVDDELLEDDDDDTVALDDLADVAENDDD